MYKAKKCLLIVGSNKRIMYMVEVSYNDSFLQSYNNGIKEMFKRYFLFLYNPTFNKSTFPDDKVEAALAVRNRGKKKGDCVSIHSFLTNFRLWRALNVSVDPTAIKFPLPLMDKFLPCQWRVELIQAPEQHPHKMF